jgi:hypothetical protein
MSEWLPNGSDLRVSKEHCERKNHKATKKRHKEAKTATKTLRFLTSVIAHHMNIYYTHTNANIIYDLKEAPRRVVFSC